MNTTAIPFRTPTQQELDSVLAALNRARNQLDELTIAAPQEYRKALYPLHDCIEALHTAQEAIQPRP